MLLVQTKKQAQFFISVLILAFAVNFHAFATSLEIYQMAFAGIGCIICSILVNDLYQEIKKDRVI